MKKSLYNYEPFDYTQPLKTEAYETFCQEYFELDISGEIRQTKARRIEAYKRAYPNAVNYKPSEVNSKAMGLLRDERIAKRLEYLYEENCSGVENAVKWTKTRSEDALLDIITSPETKNADKLKAIDMLNTLRDIKPVEKPKEDIIDSVTAFFNKLKAE